MNSKPSFAAAPLAFSSPSTVKPESTPSWPQSWPTSTRFVAGLADITDITVLARRASGDIVACVAFGRTSSKLDSHHHVDASTSLLAAMRSECTRA